MKNPLLKLKNLFTKVAAKKYAGNLFYAVLTFIVLLAGGRPAMAQQPTLSYASPQVYNVGTAITPLAPTSTGVAAVSYNGGSQAVNSGSFPVNLWGPNAKIYPEAVTADPAGNIYLGVDNVIVKCNAQGNYLATLANLGSGQIREIALDAAGNIYATSLGEATVFEVRASDGALLNRGSGIVNPWGIAVDQGGNIYVSDLVNGLNCTIKKIQAGSNNTTSILSANNALYVGLDAIGNLYFTGGNSFGTPILNELAVGATTPTQLDYIGSPYGLVVDAAGNAYVSSEGTSNGVITMYPANGGSSMGVGNDSGLENGANIGLDVRGNVYVADNLNGQTVKETPNGGYFSSGLPAGLSFDNNTGIFSGTPTAGARAADYSVYAYNPGNVTVGTVNITVLDGSDGNDSLSYLSAGGSTLSPAFTPATAAYTSTNVANTVTSVNITAVTSDPAGTITINGTPATSNVPLNLPVVQGSNVFNIVVTAINNANRTYTLTVIRNSFPATVSYASPKKYTIGTAITSLSPSSSNLGTFSTYITKQAGIGSGYTSPSGVALDNAGNLYVADYGSGNVLKVPVTGGTPAAIGTGFVHPQGLALDSAGNVYVVDGGSNLVKKILAGTNTTVTIGTDYTFGAPKAVAVDVNGNVFVADYQNKNIVEIHADASATSVYASTSNGSSAFVALSGIAVDGAGNVYVSDSGVAQITKVPAGGGTPQFLTPSFSSPNAVSADAAGDLFVSDAGSITMIPAGTSTTVALASYNVSALAADGAGDLYTATSSSNTVAEIKPVGGYFISRPLPAGLSFNYTTGAITGTPTTASAAKNYTVTINNYTTSATGNISISTGSGNTALANLAISSGTLAPAFGAGTTNYTATVPYVTSSITITPTAADNTEVIKVNGITVASGTAVNIPLVEGDNTITTLVKAQDSVSTRTYTTVVTRTVTLATLAGITPGTGSLSPAFDANTTAYTLPETNTVNAVNLNIVPVDTGATVAVTTTNNSATVTGSGNVYAIALNSATRTNTGNTPVSIVVTAVDGTTKKEYDVNITQALSSDALLSNFTVTNFSYYPSFSSTENYYSSEGVAYAVSSTTVTATTDDPTAMLTVNGSPTLSGTPVNVPLVEGDNTITMVVTAQDGTTQTYYCSVHRYPPVATLEELAGNGTLSPAYDQSVHSYTLSVVNYLTSTYLIVYPQDTAATVSVVTTKDGAALTRGTNYEYPINLSGSGATQSRDTIMVPVTVTITAADGNSQEVYNVNVIKVLSSDASLEQLGLTNSSNFGIAQTPDFDAATLNYSATVDYSTTSVIVSPVSTDGEATVAVNNTAVPRFGTISVPLSEGDNIIKTVVTAQDGVATETYTTTVTRTVSPSTLSSITGQSGTLSPAFDANTTSYSFLSVDPTLTTFQLRAIPTDPLATMTVTTVNNSTVVPTAGSDFYNIDLNSSTSRLSAGNLVTPVSFVVTAQDGTQKEYDINLVQTPQANASVSGLSLTYGYIPFSPSTHNYTTGRINISITNDPITVFTTDPTTSVTINGVTQVAGYGGAQFNVPLVAGYNTINILTTAQDGTTTQTYTVIIPFGPADVSLSSITSDSGGLSPAFDPGTTSYTVANPGNAASVNITAIPDDPTAIVSVQTLYGPITLTGNNNVYTLPLNSTDYSSSLGAAPVTITVKASDNSNQQTYTLYVQWNPSSDNTLSSVVVASGTASQQATLNSPNFYVATVPYGATSISVTPTTNDPNATMMINGNPVASGTVVNETISSTGASYVNVVVTAQNGVTVYNTILILHGSPVVTLSNLTVNTGSLSPSFDPNNYGNYFVTVSGATSSIVITPTTTDPAATVSINSTSGPSGTPISVPLSGGANYITVMVTGADGITTSYYDMIIIREPSDASLSNLTLNDGTLSPSFDPNNNSYQASVSFLRSTLKITPTTTDPTATVNVNGTSGASGTAFSVPLIKGYNYFQVIVTGSDGVTQQYYYLQIFRSQADQLTNLTLSAGSLNPSFDPGTTSYTTIVPDSISSITVTPTADPTANITINGTPVTTGTAFGINLPVGNTTITTIVTGRNSQVDTYTTTVTRLMAPAVVNYPSSAETYFKGHAITAFAPAVTGTVSPGYGNSYVKIDSTSFPNPSGIATDTAGNIYITNAYPNKLYKIPAGVTHRVLLQTLPKIPTAVTTDAAGNLYVAFFHGITMIPANGGAQQEIGVESGDITAMAVNAAGDIYFNNTRTDGVYKLPAGSTSTTMPTLVSNQFYYPLGLALDPAGNLYVADEYNSLMKIAAGTTTPVVVNTNINGPVSVTSDKSGNIFVAEYDGVIQEVPANGSSVITTYAYPPGSGGPGGGGTDIDGIVADSKGHIFVAQFTNGQTSIDKITLGTYAISPALPAGLAFNTTTGVISGTPTVVSPPTNYTITAGNEGGNNLATVNIRVVAGTPQVITFAGLGTKVYGTADYDPGATSTNDSIPVTYASSDTSVATIINNKIHITGIGTVNITASQAGDTSHMAAQNITRLLTVKPAPLQIIAQNKSRHYDVANPVFTIKYKGFVNGDSTSVLSSPAVTSTTATITSPAGTYPITVSGAVAANYTITYKAGVLTIDAPIIDVAHIDPGSTDNVVQPLNDLGAKDDVAVNEAVSPNGDGVNDFLKIDGIEKYPDNKLMIMNTSGQPVFEAGNYDNINHLFDGHSNKGEMQRPGTYYYSLQYRVNGKLRSKTGYFVLKY